MPAKSKKQRRFMAMVEQTKKGKLKGASPNVKKAAKSMTIKQARDFAKTKEKGLPTKVRKRKGAK